MIVTVKALDKPNSFSQWAISIVEKDTASMMERSAIICERLIKENIMSTSAMPTGKLAEAFFKEHMGDNIWGIGDIPYLNSNAEHWRHINYGSVAIGAKWQHYLPTGQWGINGRFLRDPTGSSGLMPKTPIQAHNYIEKTLVDLELAIQQTI